MKGSTEITGLTLAECEAGIRAAASNMVFTVGTYLIAAKAQLSHGEWLPWLEKMGFNVSTANKYMQYTREIPEGGALAALPFTKAMALLKLPAEEREDFARENAVEDKSAAEIKRLIEERNKAQDDASTYRNSAIHWKQEAEYRATRIEELESHPALVQQVIETPDDYQQLKMDAAHHASEMQEAFDAVEEAERRAQAAESELARLRMQGGGAEADRFQATQGAANTFLMAVQLLPYDRQELASAYNRQRYGSLVKSIRDWCDEMADALAVGSMDAEGAVV